MVYESVDPKGLVTRLTYDAAGRETIRVLNPGASSSSSSRSRAEKESRKGDRSIKPAFVIDGEKKRKRKGDRSIKTAFVIDDYQEPDIKGTLADLSGSDDSDTGDIYSGWDRFGRVKDCRWYDYGSSPDAARIQYGYDRAGNRTWHYDPVATANSAKFDELYGYDAIQLLKDMARGTLNAGKTAISTETFAQCWSLDATGNWQGFREDDNGDGSWRALACAAGW